MLHAGTQPFHRAEFYAIVSADVTVAVNRDWSVVSKKPFREAIEPARPIEGEGVLKVYSKS
ncbi:hypothetical protein [Caulobacter sp. RHG1]|uniref:hypothetical protein n=1 Tax=Caulobacter sp. (strain RHG1) TaxID=2545762 RepID=UPI0019D5FA52|nr:hypothetical protein [Caulobacter sp. RHG1]